MKEWARERILTVEEEQEAWLRRSPDDVARLVEQYLPLLAFHARRFRGCGVDFDSLMSAGADGLLKGIPKWQPNGGGNPKTYLTHKIRSAIKDFLRHEAASRSRRRREPERVPLDTGPVRNPKETYRYKILEKAVRPVAKSESSESMDTNDTWEFLGQGLSKRQAEILRRYYHDGVTLKEAGRALGVSGARASQVRAEAIDLLRERFEGREEQLFDALGAR